MAANWILRSLASARTRRQASPRASVGSDRCTAHMVERYRCRSRPVRSQLACGAARCARLAGVAEQPGRSMHDVLTLEETAPDRFTAPTPAEGPPRLYGGQVAAQALRAACATV